MNEKMLMAAAEIVRQLYALENPEDITKVKIVAAAVIRRALLVDSTGKPVVADRFQGSVKSEEFWAVAEEAGFSRIAGKSGPGGSRQMIGKGVL